MSWASPYIEQLQAGKTVKFRPRGHSMKPLINSGDLVTVEPCSNAEIDDVVLCKVNGRHYLHLVMAKMDDQFLIGNKRGRANGWISKNSLFGKAIKVEP